MFGPPSPVQQARNSYPEAAGYTKELSLGFMLWQIVKLLTIISIGLPTLGIVGYLLTHGFQRPLQAFRELLDPVLVVGFVLLIFGLSAFFGVAVLFFWAFTVGKRETANTLDQQGVVTQGVVIDRWTQTGGDAHNHYTRLYLAYRYGNCIVKQLVSSRAHKRYQVGTAVQVRYLPSNPLVARLEGAH